MSTSRERIKLAGRHALVLDYITPNIGKALVPASSEDWSGCSDPGSEPLLPPGMQILTLPELRTAAVSRFAASSRRGELWAALERFYLALDRANVAREIWIGGSFVTRMLDPGDIDIVVVLDVERMAELDLRAVSQVYEVLLDQAARLADGLDVSAMFEGDLILRAYWQGVFGFGQGARAKGIVVVPMTGAGAISTACASGSNGAA